MTTSPFGQAPPAFGAVPPPTSPAPSAPPETPETPEPSEPRRRRFLLAAGAAGVATALAAFLVLPGVLAGSDETASAPPTGAAAPAPTEPQVVPVSPLPSLTQVAGRNPFQPLTAGSGTAGETALQSEVGATAGSTPTSASTGAAVGTSAPAGAAGADGADGIDGIDGLNGLEGLPGADGAPGESPEYVWVTYRGPNAEGTAGTFDIITREGLVTTDVVPRRIEPGEPLQTGSLGGGRGTAASFVYFLGFTGRDDQQAKLQFVPPPATEVGTVPDLRFTADVGDPLSFLLPTYAD